MELCFVLLKQDIANGVPKGKIFYKLLTFQYVFKIMQIKALLLNY